MNRKGNRDDPPPTILILEDDPARRNGFSEAIEAIPLALEMEVVATATAFTDAFKDLSPPPSLISLDYDLGPGDASDASPGRGTDVADFLKSLDPVCPVILHTNDAMGRDAMEHTLRNAGWTVHALEPAGPPGLWIPNQWLPIVEKLLT